MKRSRKRVERRRSGAGPNCVPAPSGACAVPLATVAQRWERYERDALDANEIPMLDRFELREAFYAGFAEALVRVPGDLAWSARSDVQKALVMLSDEVLLWLDEGEAREPLRVVEGGKR